LARDRRARGARRETPARSTSDSRGTRGARAHRRRSLPRSRVQHHREHPGHGPPQRVGHHQVARAAEGRHRGEGHHEPDEGTRRGSTGRAGHGATRARRSRRVSTREA
jgi:hypothetical protein